MEFFDRYKAAIFDLDGTLADSMPIWEDSCSNWLREKGFKPAETLEQEIMIRTVTEAAIYVIEQYQLVMTPEQVVLSWGEQTLQQYREKVELKAGARTLLNHLKHRGYRLGIATSTLRQGCAAFLKQHGLEEYFSAVIFSDDVGVNKTHPDVYLACARVLGAEPETCVVFEDLWAAVQGVRAAGMGLVAVYDAACAHWEQFSAEADVAVRSLEELTEAASTFPRL